jgi:glycosyltransferase involved in cell wall biosynthesis
MMAAGGKIRVMLAGPYPHAGGMLGTYGRIFGNMQASSIFEDDIEFTPHRMTLPEDGGFAKRFIVDIARAVGTLRRGPDIFHLITQKFRSTYREYPILRMARLAGIRSIVDIRAGSLREMMDREGGALQKKMMRGIVRTADAVIVECPKDIGLVQERFGRRASQLPNVALQRDLDRISPAADLPDAERPVRVIHSGRYAKFKGTIVLLESLGTLSKMGVRAELHLTGQGKDPDVLEAIARYAANPPVGTAVIDHGWDVPDLYELMASGHLFAMLSDWHGEGHPNVVTEAMMAGLAMVLSDWTHREDIVPDGGALIVPPGDPVAAAEAIARYARDHDLLRQARELNRNFVERNYVDQVCYPRLLDLYRNVQAGRAGG